MELEQYSTIKRSVKHLLGIDLNHYKDEQMRRRLDSWLVRSGMTSWELYLQRLKLDQTELSRFRDYLTINVSEFFRDGERWQTMRQQVLPGLLREANTRVPRSGLRVWSAGCSTGQEPYTLAILLDELARGQAHSILATDLDRGALNKARARGPYLPDDLRSIPPAERANYFDAQGSSFFIKEKYARWIQFREHNLLEDPFEGGFDLIVCRNVVIYFTNEAKTVLYQKFQAALRPGGILFVGGTEIIPRPQEIGLRSVGVSLYWKE